MFYLIIFCFLVLLYDTSLGNLYALLQDEGGIIYQPFINLVSGNYVKGIL